MTKLLTAADTSVAQLIGLDRPRALLLLLREKEQREKENTLARYWPYAKQAYFHRMAGQFREVLLCASSQSGKTLCAAQEVAMHLTGLYPEWWKGRRFDKAIVALAGSESSEMTKKGVQRYLFGRDIGSSIGTGSIPKRSIIRWTRNRHAGDMIDTAYISHVSGGTSQISLKSYDQGRERWQADTVNLVWFDEEPPEDVYNEGLTRTNVGLGPIITTFTPLKGLTPLVNRFLSGKYPDTCVVNMTIWDAEHYTDDERAAIIAAYPEHEREARAYGKPMLGSGLIFPVARSQLEVQPFTIPGHWRRICGLDFGFTHPTAAAWLAIDPDAGITYLTDGHRQSGELVPVHASAIKSRGQWIPVAWPGDGENETAAGPALRTQYSAEGVNMLPGRAEFERTGVDGETERSLVSVEAGLQMMLGDMQTGRFKVFSNVQPWWDEQAIYHRENGKVVKEKDDFISATRYGYMMRRFAQAAPAGKMRAERRVDNWRV